MSNLLFHNTPFFFPLFLFQYPNYVSHFFPFQVIFPIFILLFYLLSCNKKVFFMQIFFSLAIPLFSFSISFLLRYFVNFCFSSLFSFKFFYSLFYFFLFSVFFLPFSVLNSFLPFFLLPFEFSILFNFFYLKYFPFYFLFFIQSIYFFYNFPLVIFIF